ncbi:MAG: sugar phosphate isomerase/epimerase [bacterium]|nr:sugar phosphate isomerase/epimerase [bacterium]MCX7917380.1 sugar phosphate isomerase/epimerase [bacterium]MDW8163306.1 sugar phosphate isomerase/epimerase family protein [Candidatus Omnitrophota bacterium]
MKIGICNEIFRDWKLEDVFNYLKKIGYQGIEIAPFTISDDIRTIPESKIEDIIKNSEKTEIKIIGTHWLLVKPEGLSVSSPDKDLRKKTAEYLIKLVEFTSKIGGEVMVFGSPKQRRIQEGQTFEEVKNYFKEVITPALEKCEEKKIYLCIEPLARTETNFINKAQEAIEIIEEINHPNLKLHLDVKAMSDEEKPIVEIIQEGAKYLKHFHVNDKNLLGPGFGEIDYKPIIEKLKEIGYNGWLSVEVFDFTPGPEVIAEKSIQYLRKFLF